MAWYSWMPTLLAEAGGAVAEAAAKADDSLSTATKFWIVIAVVVGSFVIGRLIANGLRLPDFAVRIGFVLSTLLVGITICILGWPPKLGIDLSGGVVLVYEVDRNSTQSQG